MTCDDIKQFTGDGNYRVNATMVELIKFVKTPIGTQYVDLNPDFQRGHVWTEAQQIAYIEYFLRGGKSGRDIYFNNPRWGGGMNKKMEYDDFVCVDGLQRITAIERFLNNEIPIFGNHYYKDFTDKYFMEHDHWHHCFIIHVNNLTTKKEVLQWYLEMNSGGTPHTEQELDLVRELLANS